MYWSYLHTYGPETLHKSQIPRCRVSKGGYCAVMCWQIAKGRSCLTQSWHDPSLLFCTDGIRYVAVGIIRIADPHYCMAQSSNVRITLNLTTAHMRNETVKNWKAMMRVDAIWWTQCILKSKPTHIDDEYALFYYSFRIDWRSALRNRSSPEDIHRSFKLTTDDPIPVFPLNPNLNCFWSPPFIQFWEF